MKDFQRLFDLLPYQLENHPLEDALASKVNGEWRTYSTQEAIEMVNKVSKALLRLGVKAGDKIALISNNRPEWNFLDLGIQQIGAVNVPVYPTISRSEYIYIFNDARITYCFVSSEELFGKVKDIYGDVPSLNNIYTFDEVEGADHWEDLLLPLEEGDLAVIAGHSDKVKPHDMATLIYTSGTTGEPKGVMLSHFNILSNLKSARSILPMFFAKRALSFLPLCHSFERMVTYTYMAFGISIYYATSIDTLKEELLEVAPNYFTTVPRLLEKVYERIMERGSNLTGFPKRLFFWSMDLGSRYKIGEPKSAWYRFQLWLARKVVFSKWKAALGGNVEYIVTGAAAMRPDLVTLFTAAGISIIEGYGLTETAPVLAANRLDERERMTGTVGLPVPGVEIRLAEDGEILAKGPNVMQGYYRKPKQTAAVMSEGGWFHTGDLGAWIEREIDGENVRFLKITGRKKELFKTSGGKYVSPQPIEAKFKAHSLIEQVMVIGDNRKFVSALIVPSFMALTNWCKERGVPADSHIEMIRHSKVLSHFEKEVTQLNEDIGKTEQVKAFVLLPEEWSVDSGELTPTMKVKRRVIMKRYAAEINSMYNG